VPATSLAGETEFVAAIRAPRRFSRTEAARTPDLRYPAPPCPPPPPCAPVLFLTLFFSVSYSFPREKIQYSSWFFDLATQARCSLGGFPTLQTFATTFVGAGIPPLRISVSGTAMPSRSGSNGGMRLVPETNTQKISVPGLYYKTFAGTKPAPPERSLSHG